MATEYRDWKGIDEENNQRRKATSGSEWDGRTYGHFLLLVGWKSLIDLGIRAKRWDAISTFNESSSCNCFETRLHKDVL